MNSCAKNGTFVRPVTIISLSNLTNNNTAERITSDLLNVIVLEKRGLMEQKFKTGVIGIILTGDLHQNLIYTPLCS